MTKRSVYIATPVYGACVPEFIASLYASAQLLERAGIKSIFAVLPGHCYLQIARNKLVWQFLESPADELLFIDADISWSPPDLVRLCGHDEPIVGGVAPFKDSTRDRYPTTHVGERRADGLIEASVLPTMMMKIQRPVFMEMAKQGFAPIRKEYEFNSAPDAVTGTYLNFFDFTEVNDKELTYGEDITFCLKWKQCGGKLWLDPDMTMCHHGRAVFSGNYAKSNNV